MSEGLLRFGETSANFQVWCDCKKNENCVREESCEKRVVTENEIVGEDGVVEIKDEEEEKLVLRR